ncbi:MAG: penicillin acylase family protein, partial [Planctomycetales bacterium]|nr:penicillin acylase family protein [Planctomycetales bacterium]
MAKKRGRKRGLRNLNRKVQIGRDKAGVPHITAGSFLDALYGLGYVHARDRLTQILFSRAVALGQAAERIADKPELLETDRFFRRIGLHVNLETDEASFSPRIREQVQTYCDGVNDGIVAAGRSLPMWAVGFKPNEWDLQAVLIIGKLLSFGGLAVSQMQNERLLVELIHAGADESALRHIFAPRLDNVDFELIRTLHLSNQLSDDALDLLTDLPRLAGSNAWAVRPERSESGGALLASDPHLEINRLPAIWYEAVLNWDDQYLMGATLPGCPLFAVARTNHLAWGVTYMKGDSVDFFIEDCRAGGQTGWQYRRGNLWHDFQVRQETIVRKGGEPDELKVYENDQGTVDTNLDAIGEGKHLSIAWSGNFEPSGQAIATWLEVAESKTTLEGMEAARRCPQPTLCFVFADKDGHIGKQSCGTFPRRPDPTAGLVPLPAWDESNHWQGWIPQEDLPRVYDPPEGFVATANEADNPADGPLFITQFLPDYRKRRIDERLAELASSSLEDMKQLQYDLVSLQARDLLSVFLPFMEEGELKEKLSTWDCCYAPELDEPTIFQRLYVNVIMEVCGQEHILGWRRALYICTRAGYST